MGLQYNHNPDVAAAYPIGWTDASYAPNYCDGVKSNDDNYRSTSAYVYTSNGTAVSWRSRRQAILATSSCDSETYAAAAAAKEAMHLRRLLAVPGQASPPLVLLGDNKSSIIAANNGTDKDRSKHIDVSAHFLREKCREGAIVFHHVPGTENISDMLSKIYTTNPLPSSEQEWESCNDTFFTQNQSLVYGLYPVDSCSVAGVSLSAYSIFAILDHSQIGEV